MQRVHLPEYGSNVIGKLILSVGLPVERSLVTASRGGIRSSTCSLPDEPCSFVIYGHKVHDSRMYKRTHSGSARAKYLLFLGAFDKEI